MIKNISGGGKYLIVSSGSSSTYVNGYSNAQGVGNMRYNTSTQNIEIYDGSVWITMNSGYATVTLSTEAEQLLDWARKKRDEEMSLELLAMNNPTIKDLVNQVKEKQDQIKMIQTLMKSSGNEGLELMRP